MTTDYRWDFLDRPAEQLRHAVVAMLAAVHGPGPLVDIGAGPEHLYRWLAPTRTTRYIAVDQEPPPSSQAGGAIPIERILANARNWTPPPVAIGALVASEVLGFIDAPGPVLERIAGAFESVGCVIVSMVVPRPDKPNWQRSATRVWTALAATDWPLVDRVRVESASARLAWDIEVRRPTSEHPARGGRA